MRHSAETRLGCLIAMVQPVISCASVYLYPSYHYVVNQPFIPDVVPWALYVRKFASTACILSNSFNRFDGMRYRDACRETLGIRTVKEELIALPSYRVIL